MIKVLKREILIKILGHYCDSVWEFDRKNDRIFIHYDKIAKNYADKYWKTDELREIFKSKILFGVDSSVWEKFLTKEYLCSFFENGVDSDNFFLRFTLPSGEMKWYDIHIAKENDEKLTITGKDIHGEIIRQGSARNTDAAFDSILSIDVETKNYVISYTHSTTPMTETFPDYDHMAANLVEKYVAASEKENIAKKIELSHVIKALETKAEYNIFITALGKSGERAYKKLSYAYLDGEKRIITLTQVDISKMVKSYENQLKTAEKNGDRDLLTGAYNRNFYEENIKNKTVSAGIAMMDLDDFKLCNDTYGHSAGDKALETLGKILRRHLKSKDILVRYGGDEFLLIVSGTDPENFAKLLENIRNEAYETVIPENPNIKLSVSIGGIIADNETVSDAVTRADGYMYRAKNRKNAVVTGTSENEEETEEPKPLVLIVDDSELNRLILSEILSENFSILEAENGKQCLDLLAQYGTGVSLVLLDIIMPVMDGFEVLSYMNDSHLIEDIPVIMISSDDSDSNIRKAYDLNVSDYIKRPFDTEVIRRRVTNTIRLYAKQRRLIRMIRQQSRDKEKHDNMMIDILSNIVGCRNGESGPHVLHINEVVRLIVDKLAEKTDKYHISRQECELIATASSLHDIGKIAIDDKILNKKGKLTPEEFEIMKKHTVLGEKILKGLGIYENEPLVKTAEEICRSHHERYDGTGYPDGLKGDEIPLSAQAVSVADVYDALVSTRCYKGPYSHEDAAKMILNGECGAFNPVILECFTEIKDRLKDVYSSEDGGAL